MMTVKECYESMEADFEGVIGRMGSEEMVKRFVLKFLDDPSYSNLEKAIQEQNAEEAFRAAHTIKGLCLNLGFDRLYKSQRGADGEATWKRTRWIRGIIWECTNGV